MHTFDAPRPLSRDATIGVCAPSGAVEAAALEAGVARLRAQGFRVKVAEETTASWKYFAGSDERRLAAFHRLVDDPEVDLVMGARGGYGWSRLLHQVDYAAVAASGKLFLGFSDFTAFNLACLSRSRLISFTGPMAAVDFKGRQPEKQAWMEAHTWPALRGEGMTLALDPCPGAGARELDGTLWGGNLSLLAHLVGTPYLPEIEDGILFIEDVNVQPYAIERLLLQLFHAGILGRQRALLFGAFVGCEPDNPDRYPYSLAEVVDHIRGLLDIPVLTGLPFGHCQAKATLPVGGRATLALGAEAAELRLPAWGGPT